jgi:hypothetical protein
MGKLYSKGIHELTDELLDKIGKGGINSLSPDEIKFLDSLKNGGDENIMREILISNFTPVTNGVFSFRLTELPETTLTGYYIRGVLTVPCPLDSDIMVELEGGIIEDTTEGTHTYDYFWVEESQDDIVYDVGDIIEGYEDEFIDFTDQLVEQFSLYFWNCLPNGNLS